MKKLVTILLSLLMISCLCSCAHKVDEKEQETKYIEHFDIVLVTNNESIYDDGINENTYKAINNFCVNNNMTSNYLQLEEIKDENIETVLAQALDDFSTSIVVSNSDVYDNAILNKAQNYGGVKFVTINSNLETLSDNIANFDVEVETCGFMAGYALVKEGYRNLGYLSSKDNYEYGYGFVQGIEKACEELNAYTYLYYEYAEDIENLDKEIGSMYEYADVIYTPDEYEDNVIKIADTLENKCVVCRNEHEVDCVLFNANVNYEQAIISMLEKINIDFDSYKNTSTSLSLLDGAGALSNITNLEKFTSSDYETLCKDETITISKSYENLSDIYHGYVTIY